MESVQTIEPEELANWKTSCAECKKAKVILMRNHMAVANHNARIYAGYKLKYLRDPKTLQQYVYNHGNTKDLMKEIEYWLNDAGTRHYGLRTITNSYAHPLPESLSAECKCNSDEVKATVLYPGHRVLLKKPLGADRFKIGGIY